MADRFLIHENGWGGEIYASRLKNGSWSIIFRTDTVEYGIDRKVITNIRNPMQFVRAFYKSDSILLEPDEADSAFAVIYSIEPGFAVACSVYNEILYQDADCGEEDYLTVLPAFLASNFAFPETFCQGKGLGLQLFQLLIEARIKDRLARTLELNGDKFPVVWSKRVLPELRQLQTENAISEHCLRAEWQKLEGGRHAGFGNARISQNLHQFVTQYLSDHGELPVGTFSVDGRSVSFKIGTDSDTHLR